MAAFGWRIGGLAMAKTPDRPTVPRTVPRGRGRTPTEPGPTVPQRPPIGGPWDGGSVPPNGSIVNRKPRGTVPPGDDGRGATRESAASGQTGQLGRDGKATRNPEASGHGGRDAGAGSGASGPGTRTLGHVEAMATRTRTLGDWTRDERRTGHGARRQGPRRFNGRGPVATRQTGHGTPRGRRGHSGQNGSFFETFFADGNQKSRKTSNSLLLIVTPLQHIVTRGFN
ncbi:hypothetical protein I41_32340 [Lacipirellula limnantheis]|uniref:Uncharacterized protein n=1 Tax=Lacipirellula limnantheis TaxID=2528024 RepID=A0A517U092_9BACT|nr:hypothetical protein I41_32340 [Lacipirellula limnantheis]